MNTATLPARIPTRASPTGVYVYHNTEDGVSLAVELAKDGTVTGALTICAPRDQFSKKKAQLILRGRLAKKRLKFLTFPLGRYSGDDFKGEVFTPLMEYIRDSVYTHLIRGAVNHLPREAKDQKANLRYLVGSLQRLRDYSQAHLS